MQGHPFITEQLIDARRRDLLAAAESARLGAGARAREHRSWRAALASATRSLATRKSPAPIALEPCVDCDG